MKNFGSTFEYEKQRNDDLMRAYREEIEQCKFIKMPDVFKKVVNRPSQRFWVSEERAAIVLSAMIKGDTLDNMRPLKREMFFEIYRRAMELREKNPELSVFNLAFCVVRQQAPKFYLTPGSAKVIVSKIKRQWYKKRKRK